MSDLPPLPPYHYGHECAPNERVLTIESAERYARAAVAAERAAEPSPLQWSEERTATESTRYNHVTAETPFGRFLITWKGWKIYDSPTVDETPWGDWFGAFTTVADAKAACQAEYAKRIAAAIRREPT